LNQKNKDNQSGCGISLIFVRQGTEKIKETEASRFANYGAYLSGHWLNLGFVKDLGLQGKNAEPIKVVVKFHESL
jgi:hypothetical protein